MLTGLTIGITAAALIVAIAGLVVALKRRR
ncbi:hypothetical protein S101267_03187 [Bacillus amyloliquefaciens]|nr:hypothetical protein S101267_03187 [Bacillus amyloliquefaciens]